MLQTVEMISGFQTAVFRMNLNGLITDRDFNILEALSDNMTKDSDALELATTLIMKDLEDTDVGDCIIAMKFETALMILW